MLRLKSQSKSTLVDTEKEESTVVGSKFIPDSPVQFSAHFEFTDFSETSEQKLMIFCCRRQIFA